MIVRRLACLLGLLAMGMLVWMLVDLNGRTAILWSFVGVPALAAALGLYTLDAWQRGGFRLPNAHRPGSHRRTE